MNEEPMSEHPDLQEYFEAPYGDVPHDVRAHLQGCAECARELSALRELRRRVRELPREIDPPVDLWPAILERIDGVPARDGVRRPAVAVKEGEHGKILYPAGRRWREWGWLMAAVVATVVALGALWPRLRDRVLTGERPIAAAPAEELREPTPALAAFAAVDGEYRSTVQALEEELEARRDRLDPATIAVVERNLAIIDQAIAESRRALAEDPSSVDVPLLLSAIYRQKLELLQQAVRLSARS
ncbi:MAG TPA: hypothetical protein VF167_09920 [Longimicrobiaceae bacterium]